MAELPSAINQIINDPSLSRMEWGIQILTKNPSTSQYQSLYSINEQQFFVPASNNKVLSTAAAFLYLGQDYRVQTPIYASSNLTNPTLTSVCIAGRGDPSFTSIQLHEIVQQFVSAGVQTIDSIYLDDTYFQPPFPQAWEWEDLQASYGAQPTSFVLNQNNIEFTLSPANVVEEPPLLNFAHQYDYKCVEISNHAVTISENSSVKFPLSVGYKLGLNSIQIAGQIPADSSPQTYIVNSLTPIDRFSCALEQIFTLSNFKTNVERKQCDPLNDPTSNLELVFTVASPLLLNTMNYTLQVSNNLYAECFQRCLGNEMSGIEGATAHARGIAAVRSVLSSHGVDVSSFQQDDGSGLSRHNLV